MVKLVENHLFVGDGFICPFCFSSKGLIYIQSHYQCLSCKQVTDPCCGGEASHSDMELKDANNDK